MASYNKVLLMGNLTRDPQLSYLPDQTPVVNFAVATNKTWTATDGSKREKVCFAECAAFGKTAENINKYCSKGKPVFVEGELELDQWNDQATGQKRSRLKVRVFLCQFLHSAPPNPDRPPQNQYRQPAPQQQAAAPTQSAPAPAPQQMTFEQKYAQMSPEERARVDAVMGSMGGMGASATNNALRDAFPQDDGPQQANVAPHQPESHVPCDEIPF